MHSIWEPSMFPLNGNTKVARIIITRNFKIVKKKTIFCDKKPAISNRVADFLWLVY